VDAATITAMIAAIASAAGLLITSLRKREDTTVEELRKGKQSEELDHEGTKEELRLEREASQKLRGALRLEESNGVDRERIIAKLRRELAKNDIDDPTNGQDVNS